MCYWQRSKYHVSRNLLRQHPFTATLHCYYTGNAPQMNCLAYLMGTELTGFYRLYSSHYTGFFLGTKSDDDNFVKLFSIWSYL